MITDVALLAFGAFYLFRNLPFLFTVQALIVLGYAIYMAGF
jgi:hypothetical protein